MLLKILSETFQLEHPYNDAQNRWGRTFCILNGKLQYIHQITETGIKSSKGKIIETEDDIIITPADKVVSIIPFLPAPGVYYVNAKNVVIISRIPRRQWKTSFTESIYRVIHCVGKTPIYKILGMIVDNKIQASTVWTRKDNVICYYDKEIGKTNRLGISTPFDSIYAQEMQDYIRMKGG